MSILKIIDHTNLHDLWLEIKAAFWAKEDVVSIGLDNAPTASSENLVKSGGVYTALQAKQDTLTFDNVPTASSNNPVKSGGVYSEVHPTIQTTQPAGGFLPNVFYALGELSGNTTFALATPTDNTILNHYYWTFDTPSTLPTISMPSTSVITKWVGNCIDRNTGLPVLAASKHYEISVIDGVGHISRA